MYKPISIEATSLSDAWFQTIYKCLEIGKDFKIDQGSYKGQKRLEFDYITIHIKNPGVQPYLPELPPQYNLPNPVPEGMNYVNRYLPYLMSGELKDGESYSYGNRLTKVELDSIDAVQCWNDDHIKKEFLYSNSNIHNENICLSTSLNQIEYIIWSYKNKGYRNNQLVLQIAQPSDLMLIDPCCLRHIDTRVQDNKLHFFPYFRSNDLWSGFPANLAAIQLLKEYMAYQIGVEDGEIIYSSKGLHLYDYVWELAEIIRGKTIEEFRNCNS